MFDLITDYTPLRNQLELKINYFRTEIEKAGLDSVRGYTATAPVILYDAKLF